MAQRTVKKRGGKTGKAAFAQAARRLAELYRSEGPTERVFMTLIRLFAAAVRMARDAVPGSRLDFLPLGAATVTGPDEFARVLVPANLFGRYAEDGFPLPEAAKNAALIVLGVDVAVDAGIFMRLLAQAVSSGKFARVSLLGLDEQGKYTGMDARSYLQGVIRAIAAHRGPAALIRAATPPDEPSDLTLLRELDGLWRDFCEGRVVL